MKIKQIFFIAFLISSLLFFSASINKVYAYDFGRPNNKFGIHLVQPHSEEIKKAAELVNSAGGRWGYITLVIQENDRNVQKWQEIFDLARENNLIPIVRLATMPDGENWRRPRRQDASSWADFLNSLTWVVKNRYVILFNEPNHGSEWGGAVDAYDYAETAKAYAMELKKKSPDFFIMLAGLDASAPVSPPVYQDEAYFLRNIFEKISKDDFNSLFDGWSSHSYPNPGFSGSPWDAGRGTIRTYRWEVDYLKSLGIDKSLPVFITETGWERGRRLSESDVANYYRAAFENIWMQDKDVIAVTPFVLDYQSDPFLGFSWKKQNKSEYFQQFETVQNVKKTEGSPEIVDRGEIVFEYPRELVMQSSYHYRLKLKNSGQAIWDKDRGYTIKLSNNNETTYFFSDLKNIKPNIEEYIDLYFKTNTDLGKHSLKIQLVKDDQVVLETPVWSFEIVPLPSLRIGINLLPKGAAKGIDFELQIFDMHENLVFDRKGVRVENGVGAISDVQNVEIYKKYRLVLLKPYYLPRQTYINFVRGENQAKFKPMLPLDFNRDGKYDELDIVALFKNLTLLRLFLP